MSKRDRDGEDLELEAAGVINSASKRPRAQIYDGVLLQEDEGNGSSQAEKQSKELPNGHGSSPAAKPESGEEPAMTESAPLPAADEDEDEYYQPRASSRAAVKKGQECPYLDTISRQVGAMLASRALCFFLRSGRAGASRQVEIYVLHINVWVESC